jgi:hypothetical protein
MRGAKSIVGVEEDRFQFVDRDVEGNFSAANSIREHAVGPGGVTRPTLHKVVPEDPITLEGATFVTQHIFALRMDSSVVIHIMVEIRSGPVPLVLP